MVLLGVLLSGLIPVGKKLRIQSRMKLQGSENKHGQYVKMQNNKEGKGQQAKARWILSFVITKATLRNT